MIKLRNFWLALALGCAFSLGTTSCDDDEEEPKQEVNKEAAKKDGTQMQEIVKNYTNKGSNLLDQATSMTSDELKDLAVTLVDYNKNKDNAEWMESFLAGVGPDQTSQQAAKDLLDQSISQIENLGVVMNEVSAQDILEVFSEFFSGTDSLGQGEADGMKQGATHQALFNAIYEDKLANIPATEDGLLQMMELLQELPANQKTELVNIALAWANKTDDEAWQTGFLAGVGLTNPDDQQGLKEKLDMIAEYKDFLAMMA